MMLKYIMSFAFCVCLVAAGNPNPTVTLNNGIDMPLLALGTWQYDNETAETAIDLAFELGFTHVDTAENYDNQIGVGKALQGRDRASFFITTKTLPCQANTEAECYAQTISDFEGDLAALNLSYVDLVLLHGASRRGSGSCDSASCTKDLGQWKAYQDIYAQGKTRAIGVSNYCISCFQCLLGQPNITVIPAVNQVQFHVGMGDDPAGLLSYSASKGIITQAYSPLGDGSLITDADLQEMAKRYNKSSAQIALKWIVDKGLPLATKAKSKQYLQEDIALFGWNLTTDDSKALSQKTMPAGTPSWACTA